MVTQHQFTIRQTDTSEDIDIAMQIRFQVFVDEQGVSPEGEADEYDSVSKHWLIYDEDSQMNVGTARLRDKSPGIGKVERVAILQEHRDKGLGKRLMLQVEEDAKRMGYQRLMLHAQVSSQDFYQKLGYSVTHPDIFMEENIPHVLMEKVINE